jgi:hypothetical protein
MNGLSVLNLFMLDGLLFQDFSWSLSASKINVISDKGGAADTHALTLGSWLSENHIDGVFWFLSLWNQIFEC